ncbi:hypothetical protein SKAU_G00383170 [Synaphobranchus kaupii]|uniref:Uncharacterized protein n=1 Tax=Synaphobranchus kaupii TaxID=118154 RepID=A0A9Q1IEV2_SYNKA|nr:hypothetical protein SKAU_G00383170 [Synaphobranchus kaupii]
MRLGLLPNVVTLRLVDRDSAGCFSVSPVQDRRDLSEPKPGMSALLAHVRWNLPDRSYATVSAGRADLCLAACPSKHFPPAEEDFLSEVRTQIHAGPWETGTRGVSFAPLKSLCFPRRSLGPRASVTEAGRERMLYLSINRVSSCSREEEKRN